MIWKFLFWKVGTVRRRTIVHAVFVTLASAGVAQTVGNWHHLIERIEVNKNGVASVWVSEKNHMFLTAAYRIGHFQIVRYKSLMGRLQSCGLWWSDDVARN